VSYIFSPELVAASLQDNSLDTDALALSNGRLTLNPSCLHDKQMEHSHPSPSGMTCKRLTDDLGADLLTSWLAGFRAKTSALPGKAQGLTVSKAECGTTWPASLARYDPATHSLKTAQHSLIEDLTGCSVILPISGLMRAGECYQQPALVPPTCESASGYWRTPSANVIEAKSTVVKLTGRTPQDPQVGLADQVMAAERRRWTTPSASDCSRGWTITEAMTGTSLAQQVNTPLKWPTPTVCGNYNRKGLSATSGDGLATVVTQRTHPTATATAYKGWSPNHNRADTNDRLDYTVEREGFTHGQTTPPMRLNPDWVEWLMGWPIGHTALKPLETDRFQEWQQQHSLY